MTPPLVFVEDHRGEATRDSLGLLAKAVGLWGDAHAVVCGSGVTALTESIAAHGATLLYVADDPALTSPLPQPRVDVLEQLVRERRFAAVLFAASVLTADVAAGLAARLEAGLNWDLVDLSLEGDTLRGKRGALQDSVYVDVGWTSDPCLVLTRSGTFEPVARPVAAEVERLDVDVAAWSRAATMIEQASAAAEGPSIEEAEIIVAAGRGIGGAEKIAVVEDLARALGGAVGATRAVVDAGWYPYAAQVGQTGKTVAPKLYIACGISGAIQHKVGMQGSGTIVAINTDRSAPIFDICDLGVIGDLHDVVPQLAKLVRERTGSP
jgi:electron transfer flavoprotein alpha subunit